MQSLLEQTSSVLILEPSQSPSASLADFPTDVGKATPEQPQVFLIAQVAQHDGGIAGHAFASRPREC